MTSPLIRLYFAGTIGLALLLGGCNLLSTSLTLEGYASERQVLANAQITLQTADGQTHRTHTDAQGFYQFKLTSAKLPLLLSLSSEPGREDDCARNDVLRPICLASLVMATNSETGSKNTRLIAHINPLSDRVVSDVAVQLGYSGPQQWVDAKQPLAVPPAIHARALNNLASGFGDALQQATVKSTAATFDPATYPSQLQPAMAQLLQLVHHNRNYHNDTGATGHTTLTDISFRPIVGLVGTGSYEPFDYRRAQQEYQHLLAAKTRIFIVGDSTSAMYEKQRYPRAGWGQLFREQFSAKSDIVVVVGSRAGRSSRDFYHGRWFAQMETFIQPGDYVFINHGHNDQNCDSAKPLRGAADVANLCTYPNNLQGQMQFPAGQPELSFQKSLERYIAIAKARGAKPILFTPTVRIKNAKGEQTTPVVSSHLTKMSAEKNYRFIGNYSQTIKDTARAHQLPLIDLEKRSIAFANAQGEPGWRDYWLVVDPAINPYYANGMSGSTQIPDGTHFQERGARAMAELVAAEIRTNPTLDALAKDL